MYTERKERKNSLFENPNRFAVLSSSGSVLLPSLFQHIPRHEDGEKEYQDWPEISPLSLHPFLFPSHL